MVNAANSHYIGRDFTTSRYFNGYLADIHFIDGQALTPSSFGEFDTNGVWQPKAYSGSYGTNGFHLDFADNSSNTATTLGKDTSGNGNNWTPNNFSVYQGPTQGVNLRDSAKITLSGGRTGSTNTALLVDGVLTFNQTFYGNPNANGAYIDFSTSGLTVGSTVYIRYWNAAEGAGQTITATCDQRNSGGTQIAGTAIAQTWTQGQKWNDGTGYIAQTLQSGVSTIRLTFSNNSNTSLGWGVGEIEFLDGSGNDSLVDSPTNYGTDTGAGGEVRGNYATLNPLDIRGIITAFSLSDGNLQLASLAPGSGATGGVASTIGVSSGKWYAEFTLAATSGAWTIIGVYSASSTFYPGFSSNSYGYIQSGNKIVGDSGSSYGSSYTTNDVIGVALDMDAGALTFYKNGTSQGQAFSGITGTVFFGAGKSASIETNTIHCNFGQRPFAYTAPSGFKALCTANLPTPTIANGATAMDVKLYTGNGSTQTISGLNFSPDLVWVKCRSTGFDHRLSDTVRGTGKVLRTPITNVGSEETDFGQITAFNSDGFTLGAGGNSSVSGINNTSDTFAAWCFDAGASTVTNTQGSITSTVSVRANASAGFSVVTYTGTGVNCTVGHGLGVAPGMIIVKRRNTTSNWQVRHTSIAAANSIQLNLTNAAASATTVWNSTAPTSTVFSIGTDASVNASGGTYVAYCFAPQVGYSSFGSYTGNGSADGPFVYTGFRPRWVMYKSSSNAYYWVINDAARDSYNASNKELFPNDSLGETVVPRDIDFLSNGFKLRNTGTTNNQSGATYIYAAFAEHPFATARAR